MKLTKQRIDALRYAGKAGQKHISWDDSLPGFGCRVYPSGKKSFVLSYRIAGRKSLLTLGQYGAITVDEARKLAKKHIAQIIAGNDPLEGRRQSRLGETVRDLAQAYIEQHAKIRKRTWREDKRRIDLYVLPSLGSRKIAAVSRPDVGKLHRRVGQTSPYEANRLLALLSVMFQFAIKHGLRDETAGNPARYIEKFPETKRDRWVTQEELPRLAQAIDQEENDYIRAALWLYLLTGARKSEVLTMRWSDLDLTRKEWRLPTTKAGRTHYIPLSDPAVEILKKLPKQEGNPYVICGHKAGSHLVNISSAWRRVRKAAGVEDVRLHDLRRTVGSWLAQSGNSLHLIGKVLNHSNASTTQIYARFAQDQVRSALDEHASLLTQVTGKPITM
jgi:integrase